MTVTKHYCDICHAEIPHFEKSGHSVDFRDSYFGESVTASCYEVCRDCNKAILDFVKRRKSEKTEGGEE